MFDDDSKAFDAGEPFVFCLDQVPWGIGGVGFCVGIFEGLDVLVPFAAVSPIFFVHFPAFVGVGFAFFEAGELFFFADVEVEFYE